MFMAISFDVSIKKRVPGLDYSEHGLILGR